ncbi:hypothetical protein, variant 2 [Aphanomyces astaci]|uniref:Uncharacterized protein n=1 Tax=Aphanomyces astaci TaxID=112090 RepID=W4FKG7_APHAT|nr:hypothetical protein, variant 2 [Aphanomyces astaci]ETV67213.1 hypothetical protein, variant 2 [Aphanomyces astaci]|eukprot:XP_009843377.1 hypothetical protein, variant 2 [Aphanomyces astaci]
MKPGSRRGTQRRSVSQNHASNTTPSAKDTSREDPMDVYAKRIEAALTASLLQPAFTRVENISCQLLQRRLLGSARYWFKSVKLDKTTSVASKKWLVCMYDIPWRKAVVDRAQTSTRSLFPDSPTTVDVFPNLKPVVIGTFETERAANLACDAAWKVRDQSNPVSVTNDPTDPLPPCWNCRLQITVVSDAFQRKPHAERLHMVLEVLLALAHPPPHTSGHPPPPPTEPETTVHHHQPPSSMKKFGTVGACVRRLPHLRHLACDVVLVLKTLHQFRPVHTTVDSLPLTERMGLSHGLDRALGVPATAKTTAKDVTRLVVTKHQPPPTSSKLPHFYHGLPIELKAMIAADQRAQRASATFDALSSHLEHNSEATMLQKFIKRKHECSTAAMMLQRVYRIHCVARTLRRLLASHRHALTIQRVYRGYVARVFVQELFVVMSLASTHIQAVFRSYTSRERTKSLRNRKTAGAVHMQRVFRGFQARKWVFWIRFHVASAIQIQRVARGLMGRQRAAMYRHAKYKRTVVVPAVKLIQRVYRGHVGRKQCQRLQHQHFVDKIQRPAAIQIERVARGYLGRLVAKQRRKQLVAALVIQDTFRKYKARRRWAFVCQVRFENRMASRIGAAGRGYLARQVYKREVRKIRVRTVVVPAARTIQRVYRGFVVRKHLEEFRDQVEAASVLQHFWRQKQKEAGERTVWRASIDRIKSHAALTVQCLVRSYFARLRVEAERAKQRGRHGQAAVVVQSAWRSYFNRKTIQSMRELMAIEVYARKFTALKVCRREMTSHILSI